MNIIGQPDVWQTPLQDWYNKNIQTLVDGTPKDGELRIKWYTSQVQDEQSGEIVTIEQWNAEDKSWHQYGLDAHSTVQDLLDLEYKLKVNEDT